LNFPSGTRYSYSNTGYNLAVILVDRVSGKSFAEFSRKRIFEPLEMTKTSWRDDYTRIVKGRAIAYLNSPGGFRMNMPFENVHGNGGLLTTVGDMLKWTANFAQPKLGDASFVREQQEPGRFNDGQRHNYALGLRIAPYKGVREVGHSGSTAGYRAYLADYPDQDVSVGVLCNVSSGNAAQYAHTVADLYLGPAVSAPANDSASSTTYALKPAELDAVAGHYRDVHTGEPLRIINVNGDLRLNGSTPLQAESGTRFTAPGGRTLELAPGNRLRAIDQFGRIDEYERLTDADLAPRPLADYVGTYFSDEAEVTYIAAVEEGNLVLKRRPDDVIPLAPAYADGFRAPIGFVRFARDASGRVTRFHISQDRVWKLPFVRQRESVSSELSEQPTRRDHQRADTTRPDIARDDPELVEIPSDFDGERQGHTVPECRRTLLVCEGQVERLRSHALGRRVRASPHCELAASPGSLRRRTSPERVRGWP
jgi:hypothetical protein